MADTPKTAATEKHNFVFVYGTLKQRRDEPGRTVIGEGFTHEPFLLYDGGYPLAVPALSSQDVIHAGKLRGQLLSVTDGELAAMDRYEGYPTFYNRMRAVVHIDSLDHEAWVYIGAGARSSIPQRAQVLPDPDGFVSWRRVRVPAPSV